MNNITGKRFGRFIVIKPVGKNKWGKPQFLCKCDCVNEKIINGNNLITGNTKSCGCLLKHGHAKKGKKSKTYATWEHMVQRCNNPNHKRYKDYGGRGIKICKRWLKFENFLEDMKECPPKLSLDRINNNLGYYKENCRWTTSKENNRNKRNNIYLTFNNKTKLLIQFAEEYSTPHDTLYHRIYTCKWSIERALTTPVKKYKKKINEEIKKCTLGCINFKETK